jgi:predicted Zn-dependent protease with MMP-like domain
MSRPLQKSEYLPQTMSRRFRLSWNEFCDAVREAVESIPQPFAKHLENVVVDVEEEPSSHDYEIFEKRGEPIEGLLLGLFTGVPVTMQGYGDHRPNVIRIFRRPLEQVSHSRGALLRRIRATVVHEFAHHFGYSDEQLAGFDETQDRLADGEP